jgi:uncharacterized protein YkwD
MRKKKRTIKRVHPQKFFLVYLILAVIAIVLTALGTKIFFKKPVRLTPLSALTIPYEPTIYLPGPYLATLNTLSPILGAETINPRDIITYVNDERMKRGIPPLRENKTLALAAQKRADIILKHQNFAHEDPYEHIQLDTVLPMVNYPFIYATENIGMGDNTGRAFVGGFMSSTRHRENLLDPKLVETGVAISTGAYKQYWVNVAVQLFAIPTTKEKYLGYRKEDVEEYRKLLGEIEAQLALTNDRLQNAVEDEAYYEGWQKILIRQREIVTILYNTMLEEQPFVKNLVDLIGEYNTNWNKVPKG